MYGANRSKAASGGKLATRIFNLYPAAFRLPEESTVDKKHRFNFKHLVCLLQSVSVLRQSGSCYFALVRD